MRELEHAPHLTKSQYSKLLDSLYDTGIIISTARCSSRETILGVLSNPKLHLIAWRNFVPNDVVFSGEYDIELLLVYSERNKES